MTFLLRFVPYILIAVLAGSCYYLIRESGKKEAQLVVAQQELTRTQLARAKTNEVSVALKKEVEVLSDTTTELVNKVIATPQVDSESCMSPVLKDVLR